MANKSTLCPVYPRLVADTGKPWPDVASLDQRSVHLMLANHYYRYAHYKKALALYESLKDWEKGHVFYRLGVMYFEGYGVEKNILIANQYFTKAIPLLLKDVEGGSAEAECDLGYMYEQGHGVPLSKENGVRYYKQAADKEYALAQFNYGVMLKTGTAVQQNHALASQYFKKAADSGAPWALYNYGNLSNVSKEYTYYYDLAAKGGDCHAQLRLANLHYNKYLRDPKDIEDADQAILLYHHVYAQNHETLFSKPSERLRRIYSFVKTEEMESDPKMRKLKGVGEILRWRACLKLHQFWPEEKNITSYLNPVCKSVIEELFLIRKIVDIPAELVFIVAKMLILLWPEPHFCHLLPPEPTPSPDLAL